MTSQWLREPLLHFALLGALIFGVATLRGEGEPPRDQIRVDAPRVERLAEGFQATFSRTPSEEELQALVRDWVREEVNIREARRLGLDMDDAVIRQRLVQKMDILGDQAPLTQPAEAELRAFFDAAPARYALPSRTTFAQRLIDPDTLTTALADPDAYALPSSLPAKMEAASPFQIRAAFGTDFTEALTSRVVAPEWQGPLTSGLGTHIIRLDEVRTPPPPRFEQMRARVLRDWTSDQKARARDAAYEERLKRYDVVIAAE